MLKLNKLTRSFHDQSFENYKIVGDKLIVTIASYETGDHYGYTSNGETNEINLIDEEEVLRFLELVFYNVSELEKDFDSVDENGFTIYDLKIEDDLVAFYLYDENQDVRVPKILKFKADSFELKYI